jgi:hypothetical protein
LDTVSVEAQKLRTVALAVETESGRHPVPSLQPALTGATARIRETQDILDETNPARDMTLLADLIAGIYLVIDATLLLSCEQYEGKA